MDNNIHLGSKIRKYRHLAGMTQEELAEYSNLSVNYISKIEREKKQNVSIEKLVDICNALDNIENVGKEATDSVPDRRKYFLYTSPRL